MAPLGSIFTFTLLALQISAKSKKVTVVPWVSNDCGGSPSADTFDIKDGKCKNVHLQSIKFLQSKDHGWVNDRNINCDVTFYDDSDCKGTSHDLRGLQQHFAQCQTPFSPRELRSLKVHCGKLAPFSSAATPRMPKASVVSTSVPTSTTTATSILYGSAEYTVYSRAAPLDMRAMQVAPLPGHQLIYYTNPFTTNPTCFDCWLEHPKKNADFKCISSNGCPSTTASAAAGTTTTSITTETSTISPTSESSTLVSTSLSTAHVVVSQISSTSVTTIPGSTGVVTFPPSVSSTVVTGAVTTMASAAPSRALRRRDDNKRVVLSDPFQPSVRTCAKFIKHKHGSNKGVLEIQGPKDCKGGEISI